MLRSRWPWIWTAVAWGLAAAPGVPSLLRWELPSYNAELAVLTATLTGVIWYAAYTYESVRETKLLSEIRHRRDSTERLQHLYEVNAGIETIRRPLINLASRGSGEPFDKTRRQTAEKGKGLPGNITDVSKMQRWEETWANVEKASARVEPEFFDEIYEKRKTLDRVWTAWKAAMNAGKLEDREDRERVADELIGAAKEALDATEGVQRRVEELRGQLARDGR